MGMRYPQESLGSTLLLVERHGEYRRVFSRTTAPGLAEDDARGRVVGLGQDAALEVGEFTRGELTREVYGTEAHCHRVRLDAAEAAEAAAALGKLLGEEGMAVDVLLAHYFGEDQRFLADLMDDLDASRVSYGYLNTSEDGRVTYRPRQRLSRAARATLELV